MTGMKSFFKEIVMSKKSEVRFDDNNAVQLDGKGSIAVGTNDGKVKLLHDILYVPKLAHNLLSIGQLINSGYKVEFDEKAWKIEEKNKQQIARILMAPNKKFPLNISTVQEKVLIAKKISDAELWHIRYDHLYMGGLKLLYQMNMIYGLPKVDFGGICEACVMGKQARAI
ncbi:Retrovirus-related Pol polyprotein from transposon TNT 1-94 [Dendrobium catenatum]|uniref:Retrovirus-related Pol polyprotein from transposon TNT 1-94 n=1 Tax=Dendrobium catenatum TaxID=906689 RepID=A0A2I0WWX5_9ASPA|nr:Retrovirus-related Pol polyprotein from transposon TNT 1-94 [Dendrobium catenatum]